MKAHDLADRLKALPDAEIKVITDGIATPLIEYEVKAVYEDLAQQNPNVEIVLKRVV